MKMHPGIPGLSFAVVMMSGDKFRGIKSSRGYAWARAIASKHRSNMQRGVSRPAATAAMHAAIRGKPRSAEFKRKISEAMRGKKLSPETRKKLSEIGKKIGGNVNGIAALRASTEAMRGKPNPRAAGNKYRAGCVNSPEHRAATAAGNRGKRHSAQWSENQARGLTRIPDDMALAIRAEYPELSQQKIAKKFGVSQTHVSRIIRGQTHRWLLAA